MASNGFGTPVPALQENQASQSHEAEVNPLDPPDEPNGLRIDKGQQDRDGRVGDQRAQLDHQGCCGVSAALHGTEQHTAEAVHHHSGENDRQGSGRGIQSFRCIKEGAGNQTGVEEPAVSDQQDAAGIDHQEPFHDRDQFIATPFTEQAADKRPRGLLNAL